MIPIERLANVTVDFVAMSYAEMVYGEILIFVLGFVTAIFLCFMCWYLSNTYKKRKEYMKNLSDAEYRKYQDFREETK